MSEYTKEEILKLIEENGGPEGLDLSSEDLSGIDLSREAIAAELEKARKMAPGGIPVWYSDSTDSISLEGANLQGALLRDANLQGAFLRDANLQEAFLWGADLRGAGLKGVNLQKADLSFADLQGADLMDANLREADLEFANLAGAKANQRTIWPGGFKVPQGVSNGRLAPCATK